MGEHTFEAVLVWIYNDLNRVCDVHSTFTAPWNECVMRTPDLANVLRYLMPAVTFIEGVYILLDPTDDLGSKRLSISHALQKHKRSLKDFEYHLNRRFIIAGFLDQIVEERHGWQPQDLLTISQVYAALLRDQLRLTFPDRTFEVEIVGQRLVESQPLELCVTFSRAE
jgi:hypothetical protein